MKITVQYPERAIHSNPSNAWYDYWLHGFGELPDVIVQETPAMTRASINTLGAQIWCLEIDKGRGPCRAWLDWSDFQTVHNTLPRPGEPYFKIMLPIADRSPGFLPLGQTVARMEYFSLLEAVRSRKGERRYDLDVFHCMRCTGFALRVEAARQVAAMSDLRTLVRLKQYPRRPDIPKEHCGAMLPYPNYLEALAYSKVVVALPGVGGAWTWRHTEAFGIGACVIMPTPGNATVGYPKDCWIECATDLSDLTAKIRHYVEHDDEREAIGRNARRYFEEHLAPSAAARMIVNASWPSRV